MMNLTVLSSDFYEDWTAFKHSPPSSNEPQEWSGHQILWRGVERSSRYFAWKGAEQGAEGTELDARKSLGKDILQALCSSFS